MPIDDPAWLDRMYNNRALVPDHAAYFARWAADSSSARTSMTCDLDVSYGPGTGETLDIFPAAVPDAPVLVFIHGGYWRSLDKSDHSFIAPAFVERGVCVVVLNYALCPGTPEAPVTIPHITRQMARAAEWTAGHIASYGGDPSRITVAGHSAGGHLAAMLMALDAAGPDADVPASTFFRNALSISGLYDLRPMQRAPFIADSLRLTDGDVLRFSPALHAPPTRGMLYSVAGGDESAEFARHNTMIRDAWGQEIVPVCELLPGLNHFGVVDALARPGERLHRLALELLGA